MDKRRIIFLDIDGVLVNLASMKRGRDEDGLHRPDPDCVQRLNWITDRFDAEIVVSSTWRKFGLQRITEILKGWGVTGKVIGVTPDLSTIRASGVAVAATRGDEIMAWFALTGIEDAHIVILDDDGDMTAAGDVDLSDLLVQTDPHEGLTDRDVEAAFETFWYQKWGNNRLLRYEESTIPYVRRLQRALWVALDICESLLTLEPCADCQASFACSVMGEFGACGCECHEKNKKTVEDARKFVASFQKE